MTNSFHIKYFDKEKNKEIYLPLEKMIGMLLALEININFQIEALKAQAIVIRTNLLKNSKIYRSYKIKPLEAYKDIWGSQYKANVEKIDKAVKDTQGMVMVFDNKPIDAPYHMVCGGSTENAENVIDNQVNYLRRVLCDYCIESPYWNNEKTFSIEEIEDLLKVKFPSIDPQHNSEILGFIEQLEKDPYGRVKSIKIGNKIFSGKEIMELLDLSSTRFNIYPIGLKIVSRGMGHGLGLCQYGADKMAKNGYTFMDILEYYYTGVSIREVKLPCIKKPLLGKIIVIDPGHGGKDLGHKGVCIGLLEKDIVLELSLKLKERLEGLGAIIYLTREEDKKTPLDERVAKANRIRPDFFISIHMDYYPNSGMKGCEMFYFRGDIESKKLGLYILENLKDEKILVRGIKEGSFYIFRGVNVSSLLIELGYLSNRLEEMKFKDENYINSMINGIQKGILEYFKY